MSKLKTKGASSGISFLSALAILFIGLKITNYVAWSWIMVLSPLWISLAIGIFVGLSIFVFILFMLGVTLLVEKF